jgi:hypothetical protein
MAAVLKRVDIFLMDWIFASFSMCFIKGSGFFGTGGRIATKKP